MINEIRQYDTAMSNFLPASESTRASHIRLAHISDPHLSSLEQINWKQLLNKRILGYLSWKFSRRHIQQRSILDNLVADLNKFAPGHLLVSGDLTHIGTEIECQQVKQWLTDLGSAHDISVIPGNHDYYTQDDISRTFGCWSEYLAGDSQVGTPPAFPSFRQRGPVAIIGLSSALPTAPFFATGELGEQQIKSLELMLAKARKDGLFRIVMLHHGPLVTSNKFRKRLRDARAFRDAIHAEGAELILHGHGHYPVWDSLHTENFDIPVIGAASASALSSSEHKRSGYNIYDVEALENCWKLSVHSRRFEPEDGAFASVKEFELSIPCEH